MSKPPFRLAVIQSHPIQYFAPWYRALAANPELEFKVFYCHKPTSEEQGAGFGIAFQWDVPLCAGYTHEFLANEARQPGLRFFGCNTPEVREMVASGQFDVWLVPGWSYLSYWQTMRACWRHRVPMMVRGDSNLLPARPLHVRLAKRLILGRWIPRFSAYLTVGKLNEDYYRFYGAHESLFFPVRHFVDNDFFATRSAALQDQRSAVRSKWGIPADAFCVLFCGKFIRVKRPLDLVDAARLLLSSSSARSLHLLFAGTGGLGAELRAGCNVVFDAEHRRTSPARPQPGRAPPTCYLPTATFTGFLNQTDVVKAYVCADVIVLPSAHETWGLVVNEAMACQKPAVVSDGVGCAADLVTDGETGYVFPAGNPAALAEVIGLYLSHPELAPRQGRTARERLRQGFSIDSAVAGTLRAVRAVLAPGCLS